MAAASGQTKTDVCHRNAHGYNLINISEKAVDKHLSHTDALPGDPVPDMDGYLFDENCEPVLVEEELVFAVAYMDVGDDGAGYDAAENLLIAKLVEANNDGFPSAGDKVVTAHYPLGFDSPLTGYGNFGTTEFEITHFGSFDGTCLARQGSPGADTPSFLWQVEPITTGGFYEGYSEYYEVSSSISSFEDRIDSDDFEDQMTLDVNSPSKPVGDLGLLTQLSPSDDPFVDVELNCL